MCFGDSTSCIGCDFLPHGQTLDSCGVCGGADECRSNVFRPPANRLLESWQLYSAVAAGFLVHVVLFAVLFMWRHRQRKLSVHRMLVSAHARAQRGL